MNNKHFFLLLVVAAISGCKPRIPYDLVIDNATILDVNTGKVSDNKTILISGNQIAGIAEAGEEHRAKEIIDAKGRLSGFWGCSPFIWDFSNYWV